jgi:tetratricopeptide (TPR) repeat protein
MRLRLASLAVGALGFAGAASFASPRLVADARDAFASFASPNAASPRMAATVATRVPPKRSEAEIRDLDIQFYEARARRDPTGAMDLARVAQLYLAKSRESGSYDDVVSAEHAARRSLRNRISRNALAAQVLASSLLSEHRFAEALGVARSLESLDPDRLSYRAMAGEIAVELGRYDEARATFDSLRRDAGSLSVAPRLARWEEIEGHPERARVLLRHAIGAARLRPDLPAEQRAWFWLRLGDLDQRMGLPDSAAQAYATGLTLHPGDYRIFAAQARLDASLHQWRAAIDDGNRAIAASPLDPATFGTISDAYLALGDTARAREFEHGMEVAVSHQPGAYHRAWSLFLLDHDRRVAEVLKKARIELHTRHDIYGYDVLAWALYKSGRYAEARQAMARALSQGTKDPMLLDHARAIEDAR